MYYNYAVHGVLTGTLDKISGDIHGATSRYIEDSLGGNAVALFASGAAGDQNPIYFNQTYELREIRIADYAKRGEDISNAMPPGGTGMDRNNPRVQLLMEQQKQMTLSMGQMLGEEVLHVMRDSLEKSPAGRNAQRRAKASLTCPARQRTDSGRAGFRGHIRRCRRRVDPPRRAAHRRCVYRHGRWRGLQRQLRSASSASRRSSTR